MKMASVRSGKNPIHAVATWVRRQPPKVKAFLAVIAGMASLVFLRLVVHDHDNLFVAAEASHAIGISVLIYKLIKERTCAGLSLKSQELTAMFLAVRLYCSLVMEYDIHTLLDTATLITTLWVIYMIRFKLRSTYMEDKDNFAIYYVVVPCAVLALLVHPSTSHNLINRISWAFCVYLEAVSVLPQLRVMQNAKVVESFTAHYVFALGVARFLSCAHWVLQVFAATYLDNVEGEAEDLYKKNYKPKINCHFACARRCRQSSRKNVCTRACGTCCTRCKCVPPGTYGNKTACPCYASLRTHGGKLKCP